MTNEERAQKETLEDLQYELKSGIRKQAHCDACNAPLGCIQAREYCNDGYDYLVCLSCAVQIGKWPTKAL
jgi:hypothetical protein